MVTYGRHRDAGAGSELCSSGIPRRGGGGLARSQRELRERGERGPPLLRHQPPARPDPQHYRPEPGRGPGQETHPQLSPHEARPVQRPLRDQGADRPQPPQPQRGRPAGPAADAARQHADRRGRGRAGQGGQRHGPAPARPDRDLDRTF